MAHTRRSEGILSSHHVGRWVKPKLLCAAPSSFLAEMASWSENQTSSGICCGLQK